MLRIGNVFHTRLMNLDAEASLELSRIKLHDKINIHSIAPWASNSRKPKAIMIRHILVICNV